MYFIYVFKGIYHCIIGSPNQTGRITVCFGVSGCTYVYACAYVCVCVSVPTAADEKLFKYNKSEILISMYYNLFLLIIIIFIFYIVCHYCE